MYKSDNCIHTLLHPKTEEQAGKERPRCYRPQNRSHGVSITLSAASHRPQSPSSPLSYFPMCQTYSRTIQPRKAGPSAWPIDGQGLRGLTGMFQHLQLYVPTKSAPHILPDEVNRLKLIEHSVACPFLIQQLKKEKGNRLGVAGETIHLSFCSP